MPEYLLFELLGIECDKPSMVNHSRPLTRVTVVTVLITLAVMVLHSRVRWCVTCGCLKKDGPGHKHRAKGHKLRMPTQAELADAKEPTTNQREPASWRFDFGKHKGLTIAQVQEKDPGYCDHLVKSKAHLTRILFGRALQAAGFDLPERLPEAALATLPGTVDGQPGEPQRHYFYVWVGICQRGDLSKLWLTPIIQTPDLPAGISSCEGERRIPPLSED